MRALLTFASLLIVLAVVAVLMRSQLKADKRLLPSSAGASAPFGGSSSPSVAQFQRELDKTLSEAASRREAQSASAGEDGTR